MRRRYIAIAGIIGPLVLISTCVLVLLFGLAGWWYFGQEDKSKLIRIISLAPLKTPAAIWPVEAEPEADTSAEPIAGDQGRESDPAVGTEASGLNAPTSSEAEGELEFSLPPGAVSASTQKGVAKRLVIPKLSLDASVVLAPIENKTWQVAHLGQTVGHLEGTAPPGSNSNVVFAAHVTLSAGVYGPFAGLGQLAAGDVIYVHDGNKRFQYVVDGFRTVDRSAVEVAYPTGSGQITLITCSNWDDVEGQYVERLVVTGHLASG